MPMVRVAATMAQKKKNVGNENYELIPQKKKKVKLTPADLAIFPHHEKIIFYFQKLRDNKWFKSGIIGVIFVAGILVGIQTYDITDPQTINTLNIMDEIVLDIFVLEVVVKLIAEGKYPWMFFNDAWNAFDFAIVAIGFMPFGGNAVTALRLVRLLRVLKLVRALPKLRILVMGLLKSLSSIAYIGLLLMMLFYLYAVLGVSTFGKNDPVHMGTLHIAILTLFRCATLEDWTDVMYIAMEGCENYGYGGMEDLCTDSLAQPIMSAAYFVTFVIFSSMMILNLFIGVITSSMQDAKEDLTAEAEAEAKENAEIENEDEEDEEVMEDRLTELAGLMQNITKEIEMLSEAERERAASTIITLSHNDVLENKQMRLMELKETPNEGDEGKQ